MGIIVKHSPVKLIMGITFRQEANLDLLHEQLVASYSTIDNKSEIYYFSGFTSYYQQEMGADLNKYFVVFSRLINPEKLPDIKIATNQLEAKHAVDGKRRINLDPGYISEAKLVLATTKNYTHRIHLQKGIFGDVHLQYIHHAFQAQPWTYPDYRQTKVIKFFEQVRQDYMHQLGEHYTPTCGVKSVNG